MTWRAWNSSESFLEVRTLIRRYPSRYSLELLTEAVFIGLVEAAVREEGADLKSIGFSASFFNIFGHCAGARLFVPLAFAATSPRVIYLDYDTVTLCDIRRLAGLFDTFLPDAALGVAYEDPTRGHFETWYSEKKLPVAVPGGLNDGVILFELEHLRSTLGLLPYITYVIKIINGGGYKTVPNITHYGLELGDQDVINLLILRQPSLLHTLPTPWHTIWPGTALWRILPTYDPPPPCIVHYNSKGYTTGEPSERRIGNMLFRYAKSWPMVNPQSPHLSSEQLALQEGGGRTAGPVT